MTKPAPLAAIYSDPAPTWATRAKDCAMTANSWDTVEDAELADRIDEGEATEAELAYYRAKYGDGPGGSE